MNGRFRGLRRILLALLCAAMLLPAAAAAAALRIEEIGLDAAFPSGWVVVTPDTVAEHFSYFGANTLFEAKTPEIAAQMLRDDGVYALAFSPDGNACCRVLADTQDPTARAYGEIDAYSVAMRSEIKNDFLNKSAWTLTGFRCSEAEWKRGAQGRLLWMVYTLRFGDEMAARGRRVYTVHNGIAFTLDFQRYDGRLTGSDDKLFEAFAKGSVFTVSDESPVLPVGLTVTGGIPSESGKLTWTAKGKTEKSAFITITGVLEGSEATVTLGEAKASGDGTWRCEATFPEQGVWQVTVRASKSGYTDAEITGTTEIVSGRIPVTFTSLPEGDVYEKKIVIAGTTLSGTEIQCLEGTSNITKRAGSDGTFSITLDPGAVGKRTITLSLNKKGYDNRRVTIEFNRCWHPEDYAEYLEGVRQGLSYENFAADPGRYIGRIVRFKGIVQSISATGERTYVEIALTIQDSSRYKDSFIALSDGPLQVAEGDRVTVYGTVTGETFTFTSWDEEGNATQRDLPSLNVLTLLVSE